MNNEKSTKKKLEHAAKTSIYGPNGIKIFYYFFID